MASGAKMKIDMKHGFMKSIIKNQVDRDNYDKEVKQKSVQPDERPKAKHYGHHHQNRQKRPERPTYIPPSRLKNNQDDEEVVEHRPSLENGQSHPPAREEHEERTELFKLEYEDQSGEIFDLVIHQEDDPLLLARRFGRQRGLSPPLIKALGKRLQQEIDLRLSQSDNNS
ncbi:UPF0561 protein C2orf68 homolog [Lineus longissimus]|uniref:UPF0561 protein C2orf68 homolog n=1 Tax=Lineus longissimus TaxID=88925 RepID=UPI002B4EEC97